MKPLYDDDHLKASQIASNERERALKYIRGLIRSDKIEEAKKFYSDYIKKNHDDKEITQVLTDFVVPSHITIGSKRSRAINIPIVSVQELHRKLGCDSPLDYPKASLVKPLSEWKMEIDDSPIFRYIYRHCKPRRHLEFGTWQGTGVLYCLEECDATVWTINLPFGEDKPDGSSGYGHAPQELNSTHQWAQKIGIPKKSSYRTDSLGFIGRFYLEKGMGNRVCQIYCDSKNWDTSKYPNDFFDTILIDGGHEKETVINDTRKAFQVLKDGGLVLWHDFCPPVINEAESTLGVIEAICEEWDWLCANTSQLFWIYPSWILVGIKKLANSVDKKLRYEEEGSKKPWTVEFPENIEKKQNDKHCRTEYNRGIDVCYQSENEQIKWSIAIPTTNYSRRLKHLKKFIRNIPVLGYLTWRLYKIFKTLAKN